MSVSIIDVLTHFNNGTMVSHCPTIRINATISVFIALKAISMACGKVLIAMIFLAVDGRG